MKNKNITKINVKSLSVNHYYGFSDLDKVLTYERGRLVMNNSCTNYSPAFSTSCIIFSLDVLTLVKVVDVWL